MTYLERRTREAVAERRIHEAASIDLTVSTIRPNGLVIDSRKADGMIGSVERTAGEMVGACRNERGFTPGITVVDGLGRDVTSRYIR